MERSRQHCGEWTYQQASGARRHGLFWAVESVDAAIAVAWAGQRMTFALGRAAMSTTILDDLRGANIPRH